jgi:parallel beta-helix repeat protein
LFFIRKFITQERTIQTTRIARLSSLAAAVLLTVFTAGMEAQCPGSCPTADDIAVQQMLDDAAAAGGGIVQLEARVYLICSPLVIGSNTHLRGAGRGATIIRGTATGNGKIVNNAYLGASIGTVGTTNVTVSDLTVDHATCERDANGVSFIPTGLPGSDTQEYDGTVPTNGLIERVEVLGSPEFHSYLIWNLKGRHMKILNNWIDGGATTEESPQEGIESFGGLDVLISGNTVKNVGFACLNVGSAGLLESGTLAVTMANNYLTNCTVGIHMGTSIADTTPQLQLNTRVLGNFISGMRLTGIDVVVVPDTFERDLTINNNTIRDITAPLAAGIVLRSSGGTLSSEAVIANTISENHIENIRGENSHGIRLLQYHNVRISGNTITGSDHGGIYAVDSNDLEIVGNRLEDAGLAAVQLWATTGAGIQRFVIERNLIRDWPGISAGILVVTGKLGTIKDNVFKRNDEQKPSPIVVAVQSCGVSVSRNVPWYFPTWAGVTVPDCP